jgi:predicted MPP superfamily phosphohydrolase
MKLLWLTDIHLNFLRAPARITFYNSLPECDGVLITGDIAEADSVRNILLEMESQIKKPIYFVLGNHDYYGSNIANVRTDMQLLCHEHKNLHWLPTGIQLLTDDLVLIGQDTWADGRLGDFANSDVVMNDWLQIAELRGAYMARLSYPYGTRESKDELLTVIQEYADAAAEVMRWDINMALSHNAKHIIVLSHVPPFKEAALYRRHISDGQHLPFYTSKVIGDLLLEFAEATPDVTFSVYSGHTHHVAEYSPLPNLTVRVQDADYNKPTFVELEFKD